MASSPSLANSYSTRNNEGCPTEDNTLRIYNSQSFIGREQPFILNHLYIGENIDELRFRAGSYSGYGEWREKLAELAGYTPIQYNPQ